VDTGQDVLVGRLRERQRLAAAITRARAGLGEALVVTGGVGIGKTTLVEQVTSTATGTQIRKVTGIRSEQALPYAALHRLLLPAFDRVDSLPRRQYAAMTTAFGLSSGTAVDPYLIGLATLTLLVDSARTSPLLCVVDDAQWLDRASLEALTFVARRLSTGGVAMFCCVLDPSAQSGAFAGLPTLRLHGLDDEDSRTVLEHRAGPVDRQVARRIVTASGGNPLALVEFARALRPARLSGIEPTAQSPPPTGRRTALVRLDIGLGRYPEAFATAYAVFREGITGPDEQILADLVEAATRVGRTEVAAAAIRRLRVRALASGTGRARGLLARSEALVASPEDAEAHHTDAIARFERAGVRLDQARARLLYGGWLRRERRRSEAAQQLGTAHRMFVSMGAEGFAERALGELRAAGAHAGRRSGRQHTALTPQEEQVTRLATGGSTNREIAIALAISENTVAHHLRNIYRKLDVTSRRELARREDLPSSRSRHGDGEPADAAFLRRPGA
jgi:DNA-binding CsgD family transcriptional regulator